MASAAFTSTTLDNFSPLQIPGCQLWLDAPTTFAAFTNGQVVSTWTDRSPNAFSGTAVASPTVVTNAINGLRAVQFNGSTQYINFGDVVDLGTSQIYIFAVVKFDSTADGAVVSKSSATGLAGRWFVIRLAADGGTEMGADATGSGVIAPFAGASIDPQLLTGTWDRSSIGIYQNGNLRATNTLVSTANLNNTNPLWVGAYPNATATAPQAGLFLNGKVGEILVYLASLTTAQRQQIEGYLAYKWGLISNFPRDFPFLNQPTLTVTQTNQFAPNYISGNTLWLDAQDTTATVGNPVTTWTDKSGSGFNATQAAANAPTIGSFNGLRTVTFNGTTQRLVSNNTVPTNTHTLIAVHRPALINGNSQGNTSLFRYQPSGSYIVFPYMNGVIPRGYITIYDGVPLDAGSSTLVENSVTSAFNIIVANINSGSQQIFRNGTLQSQNTQALTAGTSPTLVIGYYQLNNNEYYQGDVGEMIVYNRNLSVPEQQQVEGYLAWKWGLQNSLPATHPYLRTPVFFFSPTISQFTIPRALLPALFTNPASIATLQYWFDASDTGTISGSGVTLSLTNKGTAGGTLARFAGTPTSGSVSQNRLNLIGLAGGVSLVFTTQFTPSSLARTRFFATRPLVANPVVFLFQGNASISGNDYCAIESGGTYEVAQGQTVTMQAATINHANTFQVYTFRNASSAASNNRIAFTGANQPLSFSVVAQQYNINSIATYVNIIGTNNSAQDFGELLSYSSELTPGQTETIEGYLAWKWGVQNNLPTIHPFRNFPPPPI